MKSLSDTSQAKGMSSSKAAPNGLSHAIGVATFQAICNDLLANAKSVNILTCSEKEKKIPPLDKIPGFSLLQMAEDFTRSATLDMSGLIDLDTANSSSMARELQKRRIEEPNEVGSSRLSSQYANATSAQQHGDGNIHTLGHRNNTIETPSSESGSSRPGLSAEPHQHTRCNTHATVVYMQ